MKATDEEKELGNTLGYKHEDCATFGTVFKSGVRWVWSVKTIWITADLVGGTYGSHKKFDVLTDALLREIEVEDMSQPKPELQGTTVDTVVMDEVSDNAIFKPVSEYENEKTSEKEIGSLA